MAGQPVIHACHLTNAAAAATSRWLVFHCAELMPLNPGESAGVPICRYQRAAEIRHGRHSVQG